jgi:hypothetical protein
MKGNGKAQKHQGTPPKAAQACSGAQCWLSPWLGSLTAQERHLLWDGGCSGIQKTQCSAWSENRAPCRCRRDTPGQAPSVHRVGSSVRAEHLICKKGDISWHPGGHREDRKWWNTSPSTSILIQMRSRVPVVHLSGLTYGISLVTFWPSTLLWICVL